MLLRDKRAFAANEGPPIVRSVVALALPTTLATEAQGRSWINRK
jgi:hypothetical protein